MKKHHLTVLGFMVVYGLCAQHEHHTAGPSAMVVTQVDVQPLLAQVQRLREALQFIGSPLPASTSEELERLRGQPYNKETVIAVQRILDPFCLAFVDINPESRVKVDSGPAEAVLIQEGWKTFLVKVHNAARITPVLVPESPNAEPALYRSTGAPKTPSQDLLTPGQLDSRFLEIKMFHGKPLQANLSGLELEYAIIQIYTRLQGQREVALAFNVGQGTQDIGFRNATHFLFSIKPAVKVVFRVKDDDGRPAMASFVIDDGVERIDGPREDDYRMTLAKYRDFESRQNPLPPEKTLRGIYPLPSRRVAGRDTYPDFFFQPQIYRTDGEYVYLPPGHYHVSYGRGPEYLQQEKDLVVPEGVETLTVDFQLKRWINMSALGWYSADHHIHAAGCSHYENPEEGVLPEHMWRQVKGEDLDIGSNLTWGPSWYYQKQFFTGKDSPLSDANTILRYDVEVSGFPSSHAGHIVLLNLREDDYPGTTKIEEWPSWTLPVLQWAKDQGGTTGYAHSGWGLAPVTPTGDLPNYVLPKMDGIGANEYVVTVTDQVVDFYSAGDTPAPAELNMWYHTLNCGFRTRISGETDFPCISDERVGRARIYAKLDKGLSYDNLMDAIVKGRSYVSDGFSHLIDFTVNAVHLGEGESEVNMNGPGRLNISVKAAAYLPAEQDEIGAAIAARGPYQAPYWHIERARIDQTRTVPVELIVDGVAVDKKVITADGKWTDVNFSYLAAKSSWVAIRIYQSAHTNPIFVIVGGKPIIEKKSAEWCRKSVDQCWEMKQNAMRPDDRMEAAKAYEHARWVYDQLMQNAGE